MPSVSPSPTSVPKVAFQASSANNGIGSTLLMLLCLILILVALYFVCQWLVKFAQRGTLSHGGQSKFRPGRHLALVDRLMFDKDRGVILFECDGKRYVVGAGRDSFTLIDKYDAPEDGAEAENDVPVQGVAASFKESLAAWRERTKK